MPPGDHASGGAHPHPLCPRPGGVSSASDAGFAPTLSEPPVVAAISHPDSYVEAASSNQSARIRFA
jgi:hypothetical protein